MIAPARVAAYCRRSRAVSAVTRCRDPERDLASALARARTHCPTSATARSPERSPPARCAGRARSITSSRRSPDGRSPALDPEVLDILRISIFQLLHLTRVPASAVVDDAVELAEEGRQAQRGAARQRDPPPRVPRTGSAAAACHASRIIARPRSTTCRSPCRIRAGSRPMARAPRIRRRGAWWRFNNSPAPLTLRANTLKTTQGRAGRRARDGTACAPTGARSRRTD